nr:hypothetical protein [Bacilli bacterium]
MKKRPLRYMMKTSAREVKNNLLQYLAMIGIGGIAVTLFVGLMANAQSIESRVNECFDAGNMADIWVTTNVHDQDDLPSIKDVIQEDGLIEDRFYVPGRIGRNNVYCAVSPELPSISKPYDLEESVQKEGRFFYIDKYLAGVDKEKYAIGTEIAMDFDIASF